MNLKITIRKKRFTIKKLNNNQENIADNKMGKIEIENHNIINYNERNETVNNIYINLNGIEKKIGEKLEFEKENYNEERIADLAQFENNIHILLFLLHYIFYMLMNIKI